MKLFKNRGNIYVPKSVLKSDKEQKILLVCLAAVVVITVAVVLVFGVKYDFSFKEFVKPDSLGNVENQNVEEQLSLPQVSGKKDYVFVETGSEGTSVRFAVLLQVDLDTYAYKSTVLKGSTLIGNKTISELFVQQGGTDLCNALNNEFSASFDKYIATDDKNFAELFNDIKQVSYPISSAIRVNTSGSDSFNLRLKEGEQKLNGEKALKLMRYYVDVAGDYSSANDFALNCVTQFLSPETLQNKDEIFKNIVNLSQTNITVKDYTVADDALTVLGDSRTAMSVYSAETSVDKNGKITDESISSIKGYFAE